MSKAVAVILACLLGLGIAAPQAWSAAPADVRAAVAVPGRPAAYLALDAVRKPVEVLEFAGLRRGDRVLDFDAGGGYYTEIMAHAVGPKGLVVGWTRSGVGANPRFRAAHGAIRQRVANTLFLATPLNALSYPAETFDVVLLHMTFHETYWQSVEYDVPKIDPMTAVRALYRATKPGGVAVVIDHIGTPGRDPRVEVEATHRIDPAVVRADFERGGFVFEGETDLLRNPTDNPSVRVFDTSIRGRTDRFAYRFRKPG